MEDKKASSVFGRSPMKTAKGPIQGIPMKKEKNIELGMKTDNSQNHMEYLNGSGHRCFIEPEDIVYLEVTGDFIWIKTNESSQLMHCSIEKMLDLTNDSGLIRIHREYAVNIRKLDYVDFGKKEVVIIGSNRHFPLGEHYKKQMIEYIATMK